MVVVDLLVEDVFTEAPVYGRLPLSRMTSSQMSECSDSQVLDKAGESARCELEVLALDLLGEVHPWFRSRKFPPHSSQMGPGSPEGVRQCQAEHLKQVR